MKLLARAIVLACVVGVVFSGSSYAIPVWYGERYYTSLAELDLALEAGEITETEYGILAEVYLSGVLPDSTEYLDIEFEEEREVITPSGNGLVRREPFGLRYRGSLIQDLESEYGFRRYDRFALRRNGWYCGLSFEQQSGEDALVRSRSVTYRHSTGQVTVGSYSLKLGQGVTIGNSAFSRRLRSYGSLSESFLLPLKNRENGVLVEQRVRGLGMSLFISQLKGQEFTRRAVGGEIEFNHDYSNVGVIVLNQGIGREGEIARRVDYVAPNFRLRVNEFEVEGESSMMLSGGNAHVYSISGDFEEVRQQLVIFSYARGYLNPQSGGFAYSDYEQAEIEGVGFSYSDKRSGRIGIAVSTEWRAAPRVTMQGDLVRWQSRKDDRQCIAGRGLVSITDVSKTFSEMIVRGVWEDFSLTEISGDGKRLISVSTLLRFGGDRRLRFYGKVGRRESSAGRRYPLRLQFDLRGLLESIPVVDFGGYYYDPDQGSADDEYVALYLQQEQGYENWLRFAVRWRTRYHFGERRWRDWELRVSADVRY